jgi:hypothetical protein
MFNRTCRFFYKRAILKYPLSDAYYSKGSRVNTKARILFLILDNGRVIYIDSKGSYIR